MEVAGSIFETDPDRERWTEGWMRPRDAGIIAEADGTPIGVAWYRIFEVGESGLSGPQTALRVDPAHRRIGVGTTLIAKLIEAARSAGEVGIGGLVKRNNRGALRICDQFELEPVPEYGDRSHLFVWLQF